MKLRKCWPTKMTFKKCLKYLLLIFIAATLAAQIAKHFRETPQNVLPEGLTVIVCHAQIRCPTCTEMERLTQLCLQEHFAGTEVAFMTLNYEVPENREIAEKHGLATAAVLLVKRENGTEDVRKIVTPAWQTLGDESAFLKMLHENLLAFLRGEELDETPTSDGIELPPDWNAGNLWDE